MKNLLLAVPLLSSLLLGSTTFAADSETRDIDGFRSIHVRAGIDLVVTQGDHYSVVVRPQSGDADEVDTDVEDGRLVIQPADSLFWWNDIANWGHTYSVEVTLPTLTKLTTSGGSHATFANEFSGEALELVASGGSSIDFNGKYAELNAQTSGGSDIDLAGSAETLTLRTSGGSDLRAARLEAQNVNVRSSGASNVSVTVHNRLIARASGGSDIRYEGEPQYKDIDESGGADITSR